MCSIIGATCNITNKGGGTTIFLRRRLLAFFGGKIEVGSLSGGRRRVPKSIDSLVPPDARWSPTQKSCWTPVGKNFLGEKRISFPFSWGAYNRLGQGLFPPEIFPNFKDCQNSQIGRPNQSVLISTPKVSLIQPL